MCAGWAVTIASGPSLFSASTCAKHPHVLASAVGLHDGCMLEAPQPPCALHGRSWLQHQTRMQCIPSADKFCRCCLLRRLHSPRVHLYLHVVYSADSGTKADNMALMCGFHCCLSFGLRNAPHSHLQSASGVLCEQRLRSQGHGAHAWLPVPPASGLHNNAPHVVPATCRWCTL